MTAVPDSLVLPPGAERRARTAFLRADPRVAFALILTVYAALGLTVLRFNRSAVQMALTVGSACLLDAALALVLRGQRLVPLSAYITGLSLALLVNYSHDSWLLFVPVYLAIGSKYVLTHDGRHVFNPSMFGLAVSLLVSSELISTAPAYQWGGGIAMSAFMVTAALALFVYRIGRGPLIVSFLSFYLIQILLRAHYMRWFLPPEMLVLGTLSSAPFFLFVFYMITDPKTSPDSPRAQVKTALALTVVDLLFHRLTSVYTFFYAALAVGTARFLALHAAAAVRDGLRTTVRTRLLAPGTLAAMGVVGGLGVVSVASYRIVIRPAVAMPDPPFRLDRVDGTGLGSPATPAVLSEVDRRVRHVAKWLLSAGDAAAAADVDGDGLLDLCLTQTLKPPQDRVALYRNRGRLAFERMPLPAVAGLIADPRRRGLPACPLFADVDGDGDQDLFIGVGYGRCVLLANRLAESGHAAFEDVTQASGIDEHAVAIGANFLDFDRDGRLDLFIANALSPWLTAYDPPRRLSIFDLPAPEHAGDRRMLGFMHRSWDDATNGGENVLYRNTGGGRFERLDAARLGIPETHWSLSVGTGDLNEDGWTDLYVANDFGPDDVYLNEQGRRFRRIQGRMFGSIGKDTYKGMNCSMGDVDRNGTLDVYVSNVHIPLQAEGSLLWMTYPSADPFVPEFSDEATRRGALNENRFGWGGAMGDLDADGWLDIVQVNGMIDDSIDRRFPSCRSYWYVNEKIMRAGPEIHTYADMWGDLRGFCINGHDTHRVYLSRGPHEVNQFVDVAARVGVTGTSPSRGALLADLDDDGDLDLLLTRQFAAPELYRNTLLDEPGGLAGASGADRDGSGPAAAARPSRPSRPHWIGFRLEGDGVAVNRDAAGSRVTISYLDRDERVTQVREVTIANAFAAQGDRRVHFGLGAASGPVDVTVRWGGRAGQRLGAFPCDRYHSIRMEHPGHGLATAR
jgi:hypothetical protein